MRQMKLDSTPDSELDEAVVLKSTSYNIKSRGFLLTQNKVL